MTRRLKIHFFSLFLENLLPLVGKKIEVKNSNFDHRVRKEYLLVDKTLMIKEFFEGTATLVNTPQVKKLFRKQTLYVKY